MCVGYNRIIPKSIHTNSLRKLSKNSNNNITAILFQIHSIFSHFDLHKIFKTYVDGKQ